MPKKANLRLYNVITNNIEEFVPINDKKVTMYVCGPTVYNHIHIGNARPIVVFDIIAKYLKHVGFDVQYISNYTDIDDRIINQAIDENISEEEVANKYINAYEEVLKGLNCNSVDIRCKVTEYIDEIVKFIEQLVANGFAYEVDGDVFFDVTCVENYGILSNNTLENLNAGERIDVNQKKRNPADFALWKNTDVGIKYESPFGKGRPGWHTECVVMIKSLTDGLIDIHGGGCDLCFPHHENEIIQSVAYDNTVLANYWVHNGMLNLNNVKMSKSLGNVFLAKDFISEYGGNILRLALLQSPYRSIINFTDELVESTIKLNDKIENAYKTLSLEFQLNDGDVKPSSDQFTEFFNDDFNIPNVITYLLDGIKKINITSKNEENVLDFYNEFMDIIDILGLVYEYPTLSSEDIEMYNNWLDFRLEKNFSEADKLRDILENKGII